MAPALSDDATRCRPVTPCARSAAVSVAMSSRPIPRPRSDYRAFRAITTRWADNDVYGHVNNVVY